MSKVDFPRRRSTSRLTLSADASCDVSFAVGECASSSTSSETSIAPGFNVSGCVLRRTRSYVLYNIVPVSLDSKIHQKILRAMNYPSPAFLYGFDLCAIAPRSRLELKASVANRKKVLIASESFSSLSQ